MLPYRFDVALIGTTRAEPVLSEDGASSVSDAPFVAADSLAAEMAVTTELHGRSWKAAVFHQAGL